MIEDDNDGIIKGKDIFDDVYDFGGWYDNAELNGSPITEISAGETGIKTLYAKWTAKEWIITASDIFYTIRYTIETKPFELYSPTRDGYEFMGWYDNEDFAGYKIRRITTSSGRRDITLYAKWHNPHENPDGSIYNPYKIANESDLRDLAAKVNSGEDVTGKYYEQTADITITGGDWTPIGTNEHEFNGNYDGRGFTISGINIDSTNDYQGLFGSVRGTSNEKRGFIQNIVLTNSSIKGGSYIGGIVGRLGFGHVKNCHVRNSVTVTTTSGERVGGIVGYFNGGKVSGCTSMAMVSKKGTHVGAVIGRADFVNDDDKISDCFSYGPSAYTTDSIGKTFSAQGRVTNVERVYSVRNTDGTVILPEEVSDTDGFMLNNISYYKSGAKVSLSVSADQYEGYEFEVSYGTTVVPRKDDGQYILTVPEENIVLTATHTPITYGIYYELDGGTVAAANPESYTIESDTITLANPTRAGYEFSGWTGTSLDIPAMTVTIPAGSTGDREYYATWKSLSAFGWTESYNADGSEERPYVISGSDGWELLCDALNDNDTWDRFSGKYIQLGDDITVTRMAGGSNHDFMGTLDGKEHTLTFNYTADTDNAAPFSHTSTGCTIKNLHVAGTITTSAKYAAGLVAQPYGTLNIENCRVSVTINSTVEGDGTHGGFVAADSATLIIRGCVFDGKMLGENTNSCGGFVGWRNATADIYDSVFAPSELTIGKAGSATFARNSITTHNCYYTSDFNDGTNFTGQGKQLRKIIGGEGVNVSLSGEGTAYSVSGITAYGAGMAFSGDIVAGKGDSVGLGLSAEKIGYTLTGYTASAGTLTENDGKYSLSMPDENVTISEDMSTISTLATITASPPSERSCALTMLASPPKISTNASKLPIAKPPFEANSNREFFLGF